VSFIALPDHTSPGDKLRYYRQNTLNSDEQVAIVAAVAFVLGINMPDVSFVTFLGMSKRNEEYYQKQVMPVETVS
jgi:superfamily II DNA helicase RecQ